MRAILTNLKQTMDRVDNMARSMESTVTDPKAQANIQETYIIRRKSLLVSIN